MSRGLKIMTIIVILITLMAIASVTYAYFVYRSDENALSFEVEGCKVYGRFENGTDISSSFGPAMSKDDEENVISKEIELTPGCENVVINMNINITSIDDSLKEESFVYEFYSGDTLITSGNFSSATSGGVINLLSGVTLIQNETKEYKLYIYIDGTVDNPSTMAGKTLDATLNISGANSYLDEELPIDYKKVKYLESSGHQYILTNVSPNNNMEFILDFECSGIEIALKSSNTNCYNGYTSENGRLQIGTGNMSQNYVAYIGLANSNLTNFGISAKNGRHIGKANSSTLIATFDGVSKTASGPMIPSRGQIMLFARSSNWYENTNIPEYGLGTKIYNAVIDDFQKNLTHNYIPALRISDSKPGMYDTVTETFFTNSGTGEFGYETLGGTYVAPV